MNILYIGEYRDSTITGWYSSMILNNLLQKHNITSRSLPNRNIPYNSENLVFSENKILEKYDTIIQNLSVKKLAYTQDVAKNIAIPILGPSLLSESEIEYLNLFDMVLVDNHFSKQYLDRVLNKPTTLYTLRYEDLSKQMTRSISFPAYNKHKIYYSIVEYEHNSEYVFDIMSEFIFGTLCQNNICLVIYMVNVNQITLQGIQKQIDDAQKLCAINSEYLSKIIIMPISSQPMDIHMAHYAGDCFLNTHDYPKNSIHRNIAQLYNKSIIDLDESNSSHTNLRNNIFDRNGFRIFDRTQLRHLRNNTTPINNTAIPLLENII